MSCHRAASPAYSQCASSIVHVGAPSRPAMHCTCVRPVSGPSWSSTTKFRFANKPSIHCHPLVVPRHCPQRTSSIMHAFPLHRAVRYPVAKRPAASATPSPSFFPINGLALLLRLDSCAFSEFRHGIVRGVPDTDHAGRPIRAHTATVPAPLTRSRIYRAEGGDPRPPGASTKCPSATGFRLRSVHSARSYRSADSVITPTEARGETVDGQPDTGIPVMTTSPVRTNWNVEDPEA